jgi:hypothetical protein
MWRLTLDGKYNPNPPDSRFQATTRDSRGRLIRFYRYKTEALEASHPFRNSAVTPKDEEAPAGVQPRAEDADEIEQRRRAVEQERMHVGQMVIAKHQVGPMADDREQERFEQGESRRIRRITDKFWLYFDNKLGGFNPRCFSAAGQPSRR